VPLPSLPLQSVEVPLQQPAFQWFHKVSLLQVVMGSPLPLHGVHLQSMGRQVPLRLLPFQPGSVAHRQLPRRQPLHTEGVEPCCGCSSNTLAAGVNGNSECCLLAKRSYHSLRPTQAWASFLFAYEHEWTLNDMAIAEFPGEDSFAKRSILLSLPWGVSLWNIVCPRVSC